MDKKDEIKLPLSISLSSTHTHTHTHIYIYIYIYRERERDRFIGLVGRGFINVPGDLCAIPGRVIPKTFKKWYLIPPCLIRSNIRYVSKVKLCNPRKVVIEKGAFWSPSTTVTNFTFTLYIYIYIYI